MLKWMLALGASLLAVPALASELVLLPIKGMEQNRSGNSLQLVVTLEFQTCRYLYRGLYLEPVASGHGQTRFQVRALASDRGDSKCEGPMERTDSLILTPVNTDRYDFIAVQPKDL